MATTIVRPLFSVVFLYLALALSDLAIFPARAGIWEAGGLTFSDELGKFKLIFVTGTGSILDPVVIIEEIDGAGPAVLVIRPQRSSAADGYGIGASAFLLVAVITVVVNRGPWPWAGFDLELREIVDTPSTYADGLSFDQMQAFSNTPSSDSFTIKDQINEPQDRIRFHGGGVSAGASARFNFFITDPTAMPQFYLIQRPRIPVGRLLPHGPLEDGVFLPWPSLA